MLVSDRVDGTPILICSEGRALIYDLEQGRVRLFDSAHFEAFAYFANGRIGVDYGLTAGPDRLSIDIPSLIAIGSDNLSAGQNGDEWTLQAKTPRGGLLLAHVRPHDKFPYSDVQLYPKGEKEPVISVDGIAVNRPARAPAPRIPSEKVLAIKLRVMLSERAALNPQARQDESAAMIKTLAYRVALREPTARVDAENKYGNQIDWTVIEARDKYMSPVLRAIAERQPPVGDAATTRPGEPAKPK